MNMMVINFGTLKLNNSENLKYGFIVTDDSGFNHSEFAFSSWDELKIKYPTRLSLLSELEEALCYTKLDYIVDENDKVTTPDESSEIVNHRGEVHDPVFKEIIFIGDESLYK